jgi:hypothetical protein
MRALRPIASASRIATNDRIPRGKTQQSSLPLSLRSVAMDLSREAPNFCGRAVARQSAIVAVNESIPSRPPFPPHYRDE